MLCWRIKYDDDDDDDDDDNFTGIDINLETELCFGIFVSP